MVDGLIVAVKLRLSPLGVMVLDHRPGQLDLKPVGLVIVVNLKLYFTNTHSLGNKFTQIPVAG